MIRCNLKIEKPTINRNEGGFNNKIFCYSNNVFAIAYIENIYDTYCVNNILVKINNLKQYLINKLITSLDNQSGVLISMLFGNDVYLTKDEKHIFTQANLSHILVVSGTHLVYVLAFSSYIFSKLKIKYNLIQILQILVTIFYIVITGVRFIYIKSRYFTYY